MIKDKLKENKGQLLIETMVAISLVLIGLLGTFAVLSQSLGLNRVATDQYIAVHLASEGIEVVKNILDKDAREGNPFAFSINRTGRVALDHTTGLEGGYEMEAHSESSPKYLRLSIDPATGIGRYSYTQGEETKFTRYVEISRCPTLDCDGSNDLVRVRSVVQWPSRGGLEGEVSVEDVFYNWRYLP